MAVTAQDIIKANKAQFLSEMSAKDIASTLKLYDLIPDEVEYDITHAKSRGEANGRLLTFLMGQASEEQAQGIFKFASEKKDFGRMSQFATSILQQLQQGPPPTDDKVTTAMPGPSCGQVAITHAADITEALGNQVDAQWKRFGNSLRFDPSLMDTIEANNRDCADCMLDLVTKWVKKDDGTGDLPRTWETVVKAVKASGHKQLAEKLAKKFGVTIT